MRVIVIIAVLFIQFLALRADGQPVYVDEFGNGEEGYIDPWTFQNKNFDVYLNGTGLLFQNFNKDEEGIRTTEISIDTSRDYELVVKLELKSGGHGYPYGLIWGFRDNSNYNVFEISNEGEYQIRKMIDGVERITQSWTDHPGLHHDQAGDDDFILKVQRSNGLVSFHAGREDLGEKVKELISVQDDFHRGRDFGFIVKGQQQMKVTYMSIEYIN